MFSLVLFSGFVTLTLCAPQYVFVNKSKTWAEAQRYCREKYTDLATIENEQQTLQLMDTVNDNNIDLAWIGLYDDLDSWKWTQEDSDFFKVGQKNFRNWHNPGPDNYGGQSLCVYINNGLWYTTSCSNTFYPTVCYDGRENASATYVLVYQYKNWTEAQSYCREHHTDLVSIRNENENQKIQYLLRNFYYYSVWIGLYRIRSWSDQSNSSFTYWSTWQPDTSGSCTAVSFSDSGKWTDENCNYEFPFFCHSGALTSSHQYHFVNESKTWTEAQRYCRQNYTDLATIDNMEEMNRLINTVNGSYSGSAWIGLYDDVNSWRWSLEDNDFYQEGERDFRNWYHEPDNNGGNELCVYMNYYGKWYDISCDHTLSFVCYDEGVNASSSYVLVNHPKTWTEAQSYCREHHTDLVSIRNETENYRVQLLIPYYSAVWIGLYRTRSWSDQSNSSFSNWRTGQPDNAGNREYCTAVSFSDSGNWTDENCNVALPFICYSASASSRQYHFVNESMSWTEAQRYCRQNYTDLATIDNMEEMNRLINTVNGSYNGSAWIGLYDDLNSWRWSLEDNDFYQEGERDFRYFYHEPNNIAGNELCVYMDYNGNWFDYSCDNYYTFVCYDGRKNATQKYVWVSEGRTWTGAQSYCREKYTDLASVRNETEHQQILALTRYYDYYYGYYYGYNVWIGLHRNRLWSDQSSSTFTYWLPSTQSLAAQPDNGANVPGEWGSQHCIAVSLQYFGQWTDENCFASLPFFCYSGEQIYLL
ncbi:macrophage mannose receptor 1-like isoform X4 [Labeo rohita]|uniref:macrophage mannose receptor 1-like isoform X4 n=1 Tax=Labeo rohita TaxID=84645 RepID=UPI0021E29E93|nr:macrophage mannose receptor 1-like isoform X4 [Labeo rohita]